MLHKEPLCTGDSKYPATLINDRISVRRKQVCMFTVVLTNHWLRTKVGMNSSKNEGDTTILGLRT